MSQNIRSGTIKGKWILYGFLAFLCLFLLFGSIYTVSAGQRAVLLTFGKPDTNTIVEGLHFKLPFVQQIVKMDVQTQKYDNKASAASKDLQTVSTDVTLNYYISPERVPEIYTKVGVTYQDKVIQPAIQEVVKAITAQYTAEELITRRPEVKDKIDIALRERMATWGIIVQDILITNFDFSPSFNTAIEAKVTAEQNALAARNKLEQIKYEADQRIAAATGEAKAIEIQARAIQANGGKEYVQLQAINKWNGVMPLVTGGNSLPFINIGTNSTA